MTSSMCHQASLVHVATIHVSAGVRAHAVAVIVVHPVPVVVPVVTVSTPSVVIVGVGVSRVSVVIVVSLSSGLSLSGGLSVPLVESVSVKGTRRHAVVSTVSVHLAGVSVAVSIHHSGISLRGGHSGGFGLGLPLVEVTEVVHSVPVVVEVVSTRGESVVSGVSVSAVVVEVVEAIAVIVSGVSVVA